MLGAMLQGMVFFPLILNYIYPVLLSSSVPFLLLCVSRGSSFVLSTRKRPISFYPRDDTVRLQTIVLAAAPFSSLQPSHVFSVRRLTGNLSEIASRIRQGRIKQIRADLPHDFPAVRHNSVLCSRPTLSLCIASAHRFWMRSVSAGNFVYNDMHPACCPVQETRFCLRLP